MVFSYTRLRPFSFAQEQGEDKPPAQLREFGLKEAVETGSASPEAMVDSGKPVDMLRHTEAIAANANPDNAMNSFSAAQLMLEARMEVMESQVCVAFAHP